MFKAGSCRVSNKLNKALFAKGMAAGECLGFRKHFHTDTTLHRTTARYLWLRFLQAFYRSCHDSVKDIHSERRTSRVYNAYCQIVQNVHRYPFVVCRLSTDIYCQANLCIDTHTLICPPVSAVFDLAKGRQDYCACTSCVASSRIPAMPHHALAQTS